MTAITDRDNASLAERQWATGAHAGALALALLTSWTAGFAAAHAREAFNFNLSMFLYACAVCLVGVLLLGATVLTLGLGLILTLPAGLVLLVAVGAIAVMWLVCSVLAAIRAWNGEHYRYPLTLRLL